MSWENWATHAWKLCAKMQTRFQKLRKNIKSNSRDISWQIGRQSTQENFMSPCWMLLGRKMFPIFKSKMILNECKIHEIWFDHQGNGEKESILKSNFKMKLYTHTYIFSKQAYHNMHCAVFHFSLYYYIEVLTNKNL